MMFSPASLRWPVRLVTLALLTATGLGLLGRFHWFLDLFSHFPVQLGAGALICVCAAWLTRDGLAVRGAIAVAVVNTMVALPQLVYWPTAEARGSGPIRLVHANVNYNNREFEDALEFFRETEPDILLIQEVSPAWKAALEPLTARLPYVFDEHSTRRFGITLMSRFPIDAETVRFARRNASIVARVDVGGRTLQLISTHPFSPVTPRRARSRNTQLDSIAAWVRDSQMATVVIGDLNTTPWSHAFRELVATSGLHDSSRGMGAQWSWPAPYWPFAIPIDHCLVSEQVRVLDRRMGRSIGSDHLPLVVDISL